MKKIHLFSIILIIILVIVLAVYLVAEKAWAPADTAPDFDPANATFMIEQQSVHLQNGQATSSTGAGSSATTVTTYIHHDVVGDLNGDDKDDYVFWVTQRNGGSGTFYYVVAALSTDAGYQTTDAIFVGDRIEPEATRILGGTGTFEITYLDHADTEPMAAAPTVPVTKTLHAVLAK